MIKITRSGVVFTGSSGDLGRFQQEFDRECIIRLPELLNGTLMEEISREIEGGQWYERVHGRIGVELCLDDKGITGLLNFLLNDENLFEILHRITGCGRIGSFAGRIYRMMPNATHSDSWHSDLNGQRLLALSINLGKEPYEGGILQIRDHRSDLPPKNVSNTGFGSGIVFGLAPYLYHRVTDVTGDFAKTAFAGWFQTEPDFWSSLTGKRGS